MFILSFIFSSLIGFAQTPVDRILAVVNDEAILESDVSTLAKKAEKGALIEEVLLQGNSLNELKKSRETRLDYLINERLLDAAVKRLGLTAGQERVDQEIKQMASRYKTTPSEILKAAKADMGFTEEEYRTFLKKQIERQGLIEVEISSKVRVSDEEVYAEFRKINPRSKSSLGEVTISHILFNPKKGGEKKALERAELALEKLRSGKSFSEVAEQHSEDSRFANGGLLGTFGPDELLPEFEIALSGLSKGQYSSVVKSKQGLHILYLNDSKVGKNLAFEKEKEKIRVYLTEKSFEKQFALWLKRSREEATINLFGKK